MCSSLGYKQTVNWKNKKYQWHCLIHNYYLSPFNYTFESSSHELLWVLFDWHFGKWFRNFKCILGGKTSPHRKQITFSAVKVSTPSYCSAEFTTVSGGLWAGLKQSRDDRGSSGNLDDVLPSGTEDDLAIGICMNDLTVTEASPRDEVELWVVVEDILEAVWVAESPAKGTVEEREYDVSSALKFKSLAASPKFCLTSNSLGFNSLLSKTSLSPAVEIDVEELCWLWNQNNNYKYFKI